MTKIASGLSSQQSFSRQQTQLLGQSNMQSYRSRLTDSVMSPGGNVIGELAATTKIIEDQRESVKS